MSLPTYLEPESNKRRSIKQERRVKQQLNSGALPLYKGDLIDDECMYELKLGKKQITVTYEIMDKIFIEAWTVGKLPILGLEIGEYILIGQVFKKGNSK